MVDLLIKLKESGYIVYIVTSRRIDRVSAVHEVQVHFDDSMEEVQNNLMKGIKTYHVKPKI
jgi:hypothetical protein